MKLLIISGAFPPMPSGEAANTFHLCQRLAGAGVEVHLLTTQQPSAEQVKGVKLYPIMRRWSWREAGKLRRTIRDTAPDAILLMYLGGIYDNHPMVTFAPTLAKRVLPGARFVTRFENPMSTAQPQDGSLASRLLRKVVSQWVGASRCSYGLGTLLSDSDAVITLCEYHFQLLREQDPTIEHKTMLVPPPSNVHVVADPQGTLRTHGRQAMGIPDGTFVVGYLGYVYRNKGVETLLRAIASLVSQGVKLRLVVLGGRLDIAGTDEAVSYFDQMRQLASELGLDALTTWAGAFSAVDDDIAASIHAVDAFVLPFDNGIHLNNSSFASLASYGATVIATSREHTDHAFIDKENVLLCPPRDPAAIAEAIKKLIDHPELAAKLRLGARLLEREYLSWDTAIERTLISLMATPTRESPRFQPVRTAITPAPMQAAGKRLNS